jgi:putative ABC transport system permease protein
LNLAAKDIWFHRSRFVVTTLGVCAMIVATIGMIAMYRGIVHDALLMVEESGADLWVIQGNGHGPFTELSRVPGTLDRRVEGIPGVKQARRFIQYPKQFYFNNRRIGLSVTGLDYPYDNGAWLPLVAGRFLSTGHYEAIADRSTGLVIGDEIRLGRDTYKIVGQTVGQVDVAGDGVIYVSIADALEIDKDLPSEAIMLSRVRQAKAETATFGRPVSAVLITLHPAADIDRIKHIIGSWGDVRVLTDHEQRDILLNGKLHRLRSQVLAFVFIMLGVMGAVVSLSVYATVLEKLPSIALLKLLGARNRTIVGMIVQYSVAMGSLGIVLAIVIAAIFFRYLPRAVFVLPLDVLGVSIAVFAVCILASWFGVRRGLRVKPQEVLA